MTDSARARLVDALARVAQGDRDALRCVYDSTSAKLFGVCLRISRDRETAEDILQEVYLKIWSRAGRFDAQRASPITWLCTIARNTAIDRRRAAGAIFLPVEEAACVADDSASAIELIEGAEERARIFHCLDALDQQKGGAIRAAFFDGLTYPQLAERMAVPLGTMKSWIRRGLAQLRQCLDG
ncbi:MULTISPECIES: sigma-70 family RNA polymerase sigma factor [unclassified Sphingomonas]|uniref:sigma-70 family RNA polymerase sigma factor n=1 Tax=unclassified Sphingomonas TaxID=196159 RepID=UPI00201683BB|nr:MULTISPECIES: sigma-70 family RNA polymerase sigma factor [unclassified Sphingomonas]